MRKKSTLLKCLEAKDEEKAELEMDNDALRLKLNLSKSRIAELELAEKMREPLTTWSVVLKNGEEFEVKAHKERGGYFLLYDHTQIAEFTEYTAIIKQEAE